jgi:DNA anti-recombination protein RmuC
LAKEIGCVCHNGHTVREVEKIIADNGMDHDSAKLLERNAKLERLLSELTEYLNAKEMQLDTMKQINDALQLEIRDLAKASMSNNDV